MSTIEVLVLHDDASADDKGLCDKLVASLIPMSRGGAITLWHQGMISAGRDRNQEVDRRLSAALIIILLISPDFIASEDCCTGMLHALQRHEKKLTRVVPILLRPVEWSSAPFRHLAVLPSNEMPITAWSDHDSAFVDIIKGIKAVVNEMQLLIINTPSTVLPEKYGNNNHLTIGTESEDGLYKAFTTARSQSQLAIPPTSPSSYKIDKSFFIEFNLHKQRKKFLELLEKQFEEHYHGACSCAITYDASNILRGYILERMLLELKRRNSGRRSVTYEVNITNIDTGEGTIGIEKKILSVLDLNRLDELLIGKAYTDVVLVIWYDHCPPPIMQNLIVSFETKLKTQLENILREQNCCLLLFWAKRGRQTLTSRSFIGRIALPPLEDFDMDTLTRWLDEQIEKQLAAQGATKHFIDNYLARLKGEISQWKGDPIHTYEALMSFISRAS